MIEAIAIGSTVGAIVLLASVYLQWKKNLRHSQRDEQLITGRARQKAQAIVNRARDQALQILASAKISASGENTRLEESLSKISAEQLREFQAVLSNISKNIESDTQKEMSQFKDALELETINSQKAVATQIQQKYDQSLADIEKYKADKLKEVDAQIKQIIATVVKEVVGKTIPIEEHEQIILSALKAAKAKNAI